MIDPIKQHEELELFNSAVEDRAEQISSELRQQTLVKINDDQHLYHIDDFIADVEINSYPFCAFLSGKSDSLQEDLNDKFEEWCLKLATKDIKGRM